MYVGDAVGQVDVHKEVVRQRYARCPCGGLIIDMVWGVGH